MDINPPIGESNSTRISNLHLVEETATAELQSIRFSDALRQVRDSVPFVASSIDGICTVKINAYIPLICVALHDGSTFPAVLEKYCYLPDAERRFEEDPHTARLLENLPLVLSSNESRYFYDLNRAEDYATANDIFGRKVWRNEQHPAHQLAISRHRRFYRLVGRLIEKLIRQYGSCLVLDLHSYNGSKIARETPLFNLGTCAIDTSVHRQFLDNLLGGLANIKLPGITTSVAENDVFEGRGRFVNWIKRTYPQALPLCLEIKKVYCDEKSGNLHHELFDPLQAGLTRTLEALFASYQKNYLRQLDLPLNWSKM
jgi:hypothetical protein